MKTLLYSIFCFAIALCIGCTAEQNEVRDAVDNVKNNVEGIQDKMDEHNKQLEDLANPNR